MAANGLHWSWVKFKLLNLDGICHVDTWLQVFKGGLFKHFQSDSFSSCLSYNFDQKSLKWEVQIIIDRELTDLHDEMPWLWQMNRPIHLQLSDSVYTKDGRFRLRSRSRAWSRLRFLAIWSRSRNRSQAFFYDWSRNRSRSQAIGLESESEPEMGDFDSGVGVKPGVDSIF